MKPRTRIIHFARDNTAQATPGARHGATGEGIIIYNGSFLLKMHKPISLSSETQMKCSMAENEAMAWDVHFCYNLSIVTLFRFMKFTKT